MGNEDYNWIDDPFDEKKNGKLGGSGMSKGSKTAFLLGVLALGVLVVVVLVLVFMSLVSLASA